MNAPTVIVGKSNPYDPLTLSTTINIIISQFTRSAYVGYSIIFDQMFQLVLMILAYIMASKWANILTPAQFYEYSLWIFS